MFPRCRACTHVLANSAPQNTVYILCSDADLQAYLSMLSMWEDGQDLIWGTTLLSYLLVFIFLFFVLSPRKWKIVPFLFFRCSIFSNINISEPREASKGENNSILLVLNVTKTTLLKAEVLVVAPSAKKIFHCSISWPVSEKWVGSYGAKRKISKKIWL